MNTRLHHPDAHGATAEAHLATDDVRAGSTPHVVRYVLLISLALAILALSAIWITGTFNAPAGSDAYAGDTAYSQQGGDSQPPM